MSRTSPAQNLPIGADESSAPLQQDQETIPRRVEYRPENQREYNNAEKFTLDPKIREDPLFLNILSGMDDVQIAGQQREILNGHGAEQYAAQSGNEIIMNWISHVQSESENFTKYEYDMNEDINNGDISLNGYGANASLLSPKELFETKEEVDLRIQSAIDIISFYTERPAFIAKKSTSAANGDESYSGRNR
ncbi:uncharacterized protein EAE97_009407 [Botrytis byssoidea]|uniref:Uncharacterized protein n=1 Tax=Botrytis byssoidea TaxID=139641 RepID=A0A9P5I9T0_9HELO|nr:uncharacterized protein EAE97_009407 [Botrytis byssoidea]KAF7929810.1 hypothetical protein EAE97_009407 [Botrytis byssoidea]